MHKRCKPQQVILDGTGPQTWSIGPLPLLIVTDLGTCDGNVSGENKCDEVKQPSEHL